MMVKLVDKAPVYLELYEALTYYRGRQQLVLRFIAEQGVAVADLWRGTLAWQRKTPQVGDWGDGWHFFFHGGGCTLKHKTTGEAIDFNGTDPEKLWPYSFRTHLEWRLAREGGLPMLRAYTEEHAVEAVDRLVQDLVADGILTPDYHLIAAAEPEHPAGG